MRPPMSTFRGPLWAILFCLSVALLLGNPTTATAQERDNEEPRVSPNAEVHQTIGTTEVRVTYGRPSVRDRVIFGDLVPYDEIWRTGANEATTITFSDPVYVENEPVEAGTYALFTIPSEAGTWTLILNEEANQWGAYDHNADADVLRTEIAPESTAHHYELMTFSFPQVDDTMAILSMKWNDTQLPITLSLSEQTDEDSSSALDTKQ